MLQIGSTGGCLPIRNVCLFNDGKGALKNITRRLPELLPELLVVCVYGGLVRVPTLRQEPYLALLMLPLKVKSL
jgi:hypothetical protein